MMKRKFLAMLLVVLMTIGMVPAAALAAGPDGTGSAYYTITYMVNGEVVGSQQAQYGDLYEFPDKLPKMEDYPFVSWGRQPVEGETSDFVMVYVGDRYELTEDIIVEAFFSTESQPVYKVTYESQPGKVFDYYYTTSGEYLVLPYREPKKAGDTFVGWDTFDVASKDGEFIANHDAVVRGIWESDLADPYYTVNYIDTIDGSVFDTFQFSNGNPYILPEAVPEHEGYVFEGWFTKEKGGKEITEDSIVNLSGETNIYAHFSQTGEVVITPPSTEKVTIELTIDSPIISVNAKSALIDNMGTKPVIRNNRTLLPVRAVVEAMGGTVGWDADTRVVSMTIGEQTLKMQIDNNVVWDNQGKTNKIDTAPVIINSRTMLPIRFVAEYFGASVEWNGTTRVVTINYDPANLIKG